MSRLSENLFHAWSDRARRAIDRGTAILHAPLLFKPEALTRTEADMDKASAESAWWAAQ